MKIKEVDSKASLNKAFQLMKDNQAKDDNNYLEDHGGAYTAAYLYLKSASGMTKPMLAKELSIRTGFDLAVAVLMIDAIDAYEDIKGNI